MISVCILTKNAQETIRDTLESVRFFSEVIILDSGSTDQTLAIAKTYSNVSIHKTEFCGFGPLRNTLAKFATNDWILALDSDEILSKELLDEILKLKLNVNYAYSIQRNNYYKGKRIKGCGWSPDRVTRLYHRKTTQFSSAQVHESLETKNILPLRFPIVHTPYRNTSEFLAKMQHYSTLFAKQNQGKIKSSYLKAFSHGLFAFFRSYFLKRGFFDGIEGLIISLFNANTTLYKYLKLIELNSLLALPDPQFSDSKQSQNRSPSPSE
jgi:glycosyltransferase involved in cell wall biosynthesis